MTIGLIAYNSAYVQTETLNFTFGRQADIVYFDAYTSRLFFAYSGHHDVTAAPCSGTSILRVSNSNVTFLPIAVKPSIDLELEYIFGKPMKQIPMISRTEILSIFHARVEYISVTKYAIETIGPMRQTTPKSTLPLDARGPISIPGVTPSPHQTTARSVCALPHNYTNKGPFGYVGCPNFTPKTAPSPLTITTLH